MLRLDFRSRHLFFVICLLTGVGCGSKKAEEKVDAPKETEKVSALRKEVIAVHDEAMPLMTEIYQSKNRLKEKLNSDDTASPEQKQRIEGMIARLDSANQGMRVWMRKFSDVKTTGVPEDEALANLKKELDKITRVKEDMVSSAGAARAIE